MWSWNWVPEGRAKACSYSWEYMSYILLLLWRNFNNLAKRVSPSVACSLALSQLKLLLDWWWFYVLGPIWSVVCKFLIGKVVCLCMSPHVIVQVFFTPVSIHAVVTIIITVCVGFDVVIGVTLVRSYSITVITNIVVSQWLLWFEFSLTFITVVICGGMKLFLMLCKTRLGHAFVVTLVTIILWVFVYS